MKQLLFIIFILLLNPAGALASEITGRISTDPKDYPEIKSGPISDNLGNHLPGLGADMEPAGAPIIFQKKIVLAENPKDALKQADKDIKVLGVSHYPDNTLVRGGDNKIYMLQGLTKKHIVSLKELHKYFGKPIYTIADSELEKYEDREYLNGELIRAKGTVRVFAIKNSQKKHILNLEELRARYFGLEIYNISREEMALYPEYGK